MDTVHECDRQTDGRTDRITITKTVQRRASHGKNEITGIQMLDLIDWRRYRHFDTYISERKANDRFDNVDSVRISDNFTVRRTYCPDELILYL